MRTALLLAALACATLAQAQAQAQGQDQASRAPINAEKPALAPWQERYAQFLDVLRRLAAKDQSATLQLEVIVRNFEADPFRITPFEAMDVMGRIFVPQAGIEKMLPFVAAHAALGLYDTYRFAGPLAQSMILENLLRQPLVLGGKEVTDAVRAFLRDQPERAEVLVREGLVVAGIERRQPRYDVRWPEAMNKCPFPDPDGKLCPPFTPPPSSEWESLWGKAVARALEYYRVESPPPAAASGAPAKEQASKAQ